MLNLSRGRYKARTAETAQDVARAQALRHLAFIDGTGAAPRDERLDRDPFDEICQHILVEEVRTGTLVCCFRILPLKDGAEIGKSYAAQYYELSALEAFDGPMVEMGRFCIHPDYRDPDILRVAWGAMTHLVDETGVELLFGCSSFHGTDAETYADAFAVLRDRHLAPKRWLPKVKAPNVFRFAQRLRRKPDLEARHAVDAAAFAQLPCDGRLGQRSRGGGSRPEHAARLHRARDPRHPAGPRRALRGVAREPGLT